jgi:hypothetical protein
MTLPGGKSIPFRGFGIVSFYAFAFFISHAQTILRLRVALFGGCPELLYAGFAHAGMPSVSSPQYYQGIAPGGINKNERRLCRRSLIPDI